MRWDDASASSRARVDKRCHTWYNEIVMVAKKKLKAVDFFSGAGGLTYGLPQAGITVLAGIDIEGACKKTYEENNKGPRFLTEDITQYMPAELERELCIEPDAIAKMIGNAVSPKFAEGIGRQVLKFVKEVYCD